MVLKFMSIEGCKLKEIYNLFIQRIIDAWNMLPDVVENIKPLRKHLDRCINKQRIKGVASGMVPGLAVTRPTLAVGGTRIYILFTEAGMSRTAWDRCPSLSGCMCGGVGHLGLILAV